jgi:hypothetical protein
MKSFTSLHNRLIRHLREWHRKLGIIAAFFLIFLSLSGIALNHTDTLSLAHSPIHNSWLLDHYGIALPNDIRFYDDNKWLVTNNLVWLGDKMLLESTADIIAITPIKIMSEKAWVVVSTDQLYFYNESGELIDQVGAEFGLPLDIKAIAVEEGALVIKTATTLLHYNSEQLSWHDFQATTKPNWIKATTASKQLIATAKLNYRGQYLTLERIILDGHSGRILGLFGVLFMDAVGVLLILLSLSGIYIWLRYARAKR